MTVLDCGGHTLDLRTCVVMGILNITPDSFSDGGDFFCLDDAVRQALEMARAGAAIIDIGGESSRPGAEPVSVDEEIRRVVPVIQALHEALAIPVSIDTCKPEVMRAAVAAGAGMINDVQALQVPGALALAAELNVPVCLMHMQGKPRSMQTAPCYMDVVNEVKVFLKARIDACVSAGISRDRLIIDPGFGFGKDLIHNLELMKRLSEIVDLNVPLLTGVSRKSMIGRVLANDPKERLSGSLALAALAVWQGSRIIRAHDVRETVDAVKMVNAVCHQNMI